MDNQILNGQCSVPIVFAVLGLCTNVVHATRCSSKQDSLLAEGCRISFAWETTLSVTLAVSLITYIALALPEYLKFRTLSKDQLPAAIKSRR